MATNKFVVEEVRRLSQEEGLYDGEIAEKMGVTRNTINRIRVRNDIPKVKLANRKDKCFICSMCHEKTYIRRREHKKLYCDKCEKLI